MKSFKSILLSTILLSVPFAIARAQTPDAAAASQFHLDINDVLAGCALLLFIVALILGNTLRSAIYFYHERKKKAAADNGKNIVSMVLLTLLCCAALPAAAESVDPVAAPSSLSDAEVMRWILYIVIAVELLVILLFAKWIRFFTGIEAYSKSLQTRQIRKIDFAGLWTRINRFKPIEEEAGMDTGHSYDGIRELNNVTPPWFIAGFVISILAGFGYFWRYHIARSAPLQIEEYNISVAEAKIRQEEYLKTQANNVDETSVVLLDKDGIAAGQALFTANCVACHGDKGQGGVGPNLTDNYWLHGGAIQSIFKSIKYGWAEKGMKSWKEDFSPVQIAQIASYIISLKDSHPAGAKEPQGDLYTAAAAIAADTTTTDTKVQ